MSAMKSNDQDIGEEDLTNSTINIAAGLVLAALSILALFWLFPNHIVTGDSEHDVGPAFFPNMSVWIVLGLSILLIVHNLIRFRKSNNDNYGKSIILEILVWTVVSASTLLGFLTIGFIFTAPMLILLGAIGCGYRKWWIMVPVAIAVPVIVSQAAWIVFTVALP